MIKEESAVAALALEYRLLTPAAGMELISSARKTGHSLVAGLLSEIAEIDVLRAIARELGVRFYDLHSMHQEFRLDLDVLSRCNIQTLTTGVALPLVSSSGQIMVAMANPSDVTMADYLRQRYPTGITIMLSPKSQLVAKLVHAASDKFTQDFAISDAASAGSREAQRSVVLSTGPRNPVTDWVDNILARAAAEGASDVHFTFNEDHSLLLRLRVDGVLRQVPVSLTGHEMEIIGTLISKSETMDSSNYREPQDGMFKYYVAGRAVDVRVAMLPQVNGPTVVLRLLDSQNMHKRLDEMGFAPGLLDMMRAEIEEPQGTIFVAGPTGSGKTTTLYALLREVDALSRNVVTVEDPVEYRLPNIGQTQIRSDLGERSLTFTKALRSILRLDPDVILVGEVRDSDTARTTMDAAITGHLCLSTIHAPSAIGVFTRLSEMGVPRYLVAEAVTLTISQRLVRQVHECARLEPPTFEENQALKTWGLEIDRIAHVIGCPGCNGTGYRGRLAVSELLRPTHQIRSVFTGGGSYGNIEAIARSQGFRPLIVEALRHVTDGSTTVSEIMRVLATEESHNG